MHSLNKNYRNLIMSLEGDILRLRDWSGLSCWPVYIYDRAYPVAGKAWTGIGASHNTAWLVRSGSISVSINGHEATAQVGEWMIPPRGAHKSRFSRDAGILSVRFHAQWPDARPLLDPKKPYVLERRNAAKLTHLAKRLERFAAKNFQQADTGMELKQASAVQYLALEERFFSWLGELIGRLEQAGCSPGTPSQADERVLLAAHLLNTFPLDRAWSQESLARQVGLSPVHLNRLFGVALGTTPKHYYQERRKRAALHLLQEKHLPIKQIALMLGFNSACYFTAWFRKLTGKAPGLWRRSEVRKINRAG